MIKGVSSPEQETTLHCLRESVDSPHLWITRDWSPAKNTQVSREITIPKTRSKAKHISCQALEKISRKENRFPAVAQQVAIKEMRCGQGNGILPDASLQRAKYEVKVGGSGGWLGLGGWGWLSLESLMVNSKAVWRLVWTGDRSCDCWPKPVTEAG